ncbi:MAG: hypothetical protein M5U14_02225 [Acidimicrobiia bacterium]|nr:hypothetical protein [Acidimicrobiia bacterium]
MAKHLVFGEGPRSSWRLPAEYDLVSLMNDLEEGIAKGTFVWVKVETDGNPPARGDLVLNGRVIPFAAIVDEPGSHEA